MSMPGTWGGGTSLSRSARAPLRSWVSVGLTAAARTRILHLARPHLRIGQLHHVQDFGAAEPRDPHRSHRNAA